MTPDDPDYVPEPPEWLRDEWHREAESYPRPVRPGDPSNEHRAHLNLGSHMELADRTLDQLERIGQVVHFEGSFFRYTAGSFPALSAQDIYRSIKARDGAPVGDKNKPLKLRHSDVTSVINSLRETLEDPEFFDDGPRGVAFNNGFIRIDRSLEVLDHSPDNRARFKYPFDFEVAQAPLQWLQFLKDVWRDEPDQQQRIECLREFMGTCLSGAATDLQQSIVLYGAGSNGKSQISTVVEACMPPDSVCSIPPQDMGHEYSRAMLAGKLLNVVSELPESDILHNESWKAIISGDRIKARHIRQAPFVFRPVAGHLYSANRLPGTQDHTHGFWRRIIVLTFNRAFNEADKEVGIAKRLIRSELPQIVGWALEGARNAMERNRYTVPPSSGEAVDNWRKEADQVAMYVEERTAPLPGDSHISDGTRRDTLYANYRGWCDKCGHRPLAQNKFGQRLRALGVLTGQPHEPGRPRYYLVRLVEQE